MVFEDFVGICLQSLSDGGGGVINPSPPADCVFGATKEGAREGGVAPIYPGDRESVLFTHEFVGTLLALVSKVPIGETAAVEALMSPAV